LLLFRTVGSGASWIASSGMPLPVSFTAKRSPFPSTTIWIETRPPDGVNLMALLAPLASTPHGDSRSRALVDDAERGAAARVASEPVMAVQRRDGAPGRAVRSNP